MAEPSTVQSEYDAGVANAQQISVEQREQSLLTSRRRLAFWAGRVDALRGWKVGVRDVDYRGGCPNPDCVCQIPGRACEEWMGIDGETGNWCPRCGWSRTHHPEQVTP